MIHQLDLHSLITALASAGLLTFAIVYVARSRRTAEDLDTPLSQAFSADLGASSPDMFSTAVLSSGSRGLGLIVSVVMHLLVAFVTPLLPYLFPEELGVDFRKYQLKLVEFRIPQRLMYTASNESKPQRARPRTRVGGEAARAQAPAEPNPAPASARPRFQLPEAVRAQNRDVVIQPDQPPEVHAAVPQMLPRMFLWAQAPAPPEESRTVGAPPTPPRPFSMPHTQPEVRRPNLELAVGDLQIGAAPVMTFRPPNLPVPAANVSPLSVPFPDPPALGELPATPLPAGSPMNLVVLLRDVAPSTSAYMIGVGNRLPDSGAPGAGGLGGAETGSTAQGSGTGTHADLLASAPNAASGDVTRRTGPGQPVPTGRLGVIIVQQTSAESGFEGSEALSGQPVYTVYLDVPGSPRRWTLQYCVPGAEAGAGSVQASEGRIQIAPRRSVQPPYPIDRLPVDVNGVQAAVRRLVIYAQVSERGEILNVRLVRGAGLPVDQAAVATLQRWTFRPATRGDTPVAVEALFGIPLD